MYRWAVLMCCGFIVSVLEVKGNTCPTNCQACTNIDGVKACILCNDGYWLSGSSCLHCLNNCATCFNASSCGTCKPEFYSLMFGCHLQCPTNCLDNKCDEITGHCFECPSDRYGYYCDYDCGLCKNEQCGLRKCADGCKNGYWQYQSEDNFECRFCMDKCSLCDSWPVCNACNNGSYIGENNGARNYCYLCPVSCEKCSSTVSCSVCKPGFFGGACEYQCSDIISDCEMSHLDGASAVSCSQCANGWTLHDSKCVVSTPQCPINCVRCTGDNVCELCNEGWFGELCDRMCSDIPHCVSCQREGGSIVYTVCVKGYAVMDGECRAAVLQLPANMSAANLPTTKTSKSSISSEPPIPEYKTSITQPESTSFQTSTLTAGIFIGIGISMCAVLMIGLVWFIRRRKRLQTSSTSREDEPNYENSFAADESHFTTLNQDVPNQESIQTMGAVGKTDHELVEDEHQTPVGEESVSTYTNIDQHDYTSLNARSGEYIYKGNPLNPNIVYNFFHFSVVLYP